MKYLKMLGLFAASAAALMAFTAIASATTLTSPTGTTYTGTIHAESEGKTTWHNSSLGVSISCEATTFDGHVTKHGSGVTVGITLTSFTFTKCGSDTYTVLNPGTLEIHSLGSGNGTVTSSGLEVTVKNGATGVSCTYKTSSTDIGTLTSKHPEMATLDLNSAIIPRTGDSILCGSKAEWTGSFTIKAPETLIVDP